MKPNLLRQASMWAGVSALVLLVALSVLSPQLRRFGLGVRPPHPDTQALLSADAELARTWSGDCPDWASDGLIYSEEAFARASKVVRAAAQVGRLDAIHCLLNRYEALDADIDEMSAHIDLIWVEFARMLGDDSAELEHHRGVLEPLLTEDLRERAKDLAERYKRDADWVAAQGWVDEGWLEEGRVDD